MWLFTKYGFFSVIKRKHRPQDKDYQVRGRERNDLENLRKVLHIEEPVLETPRGDYRYRILVDKEQLHQLMYTLVEELDYENFKKTMSSYPDQKQKMEAYNEVWGIMYDHQNRSL